VVDGLGYYRVRTLSNPRARRDPDLLRGRLERERDHGVIPFEPASEDRPFIESALTALARFQTRPSSGRDDAWDDVIAAVDDLLEVRERRRRSTTGGTT
jgi:hypothetical protein